jgi:hypothetical protein
MKAKTTITGVALALAIALVTGVTPALAVHDVGLFELDRNAVDSVPPAMGGANLPDDWDTVNLPLPLGSGGSSFAHTGVIQETDPDTSKFTGGGSKDNNDLNQWQFNTGNPSPDKDNVTNAYAAAYTNPANGHLIIYFGLDRHANNGSAQVGFWFFQNPVQLCTNPANQNNCTVGTFVDDTGAPAAHAVGDLLIQSNFSQGGVISTISVFEWVGSGGSNGALDLLISAADCIPGTSGDLACGTVNQANTPAPWPFTPKFGTAGVFPQGSFYEGGVDLTALLGNVCFSTFLAETRSSTPFDAVLKDFAGPAAFSTCGISVTKECEATVNTGGNDVNVHVSGTVCNEGAATATVTSLVDDKAGDLLASLSSTTLAPKGQAGECATYSGDYTSTTAADNTDTVTAEATEGGQTVTASAGATCSVPVNAAITVDKTCVAAVNSAGDGVVVSFSGTVTNTGNVALSGVSVSNDKGGVTVQPSPTLAPNASSTYSGTYASTTIDNTDTVTASATGALNQGAVSDTDTFTCHAPVNRSISVDKVCDFDVVSGALEVNFSNDPTDAAGGGSGICNTGIEKLVNVTLVNNQPAAGTPVTLSQNTLTPGECIPYSGQYAFTGSSTTPDSITAIDTVTANGVGAITGLAAEPATASACCTLCPGTTCP